MVVKVYVALISCSQEVKKNQQRALMILESKKIPYVITDITDPSNEDAKDYMVENATVKEGSKVPVTPQIFNEADYCGDYDALDMANECDTLGDFLKLSDEEKAAIKIGITGIIQPEGNKPEENVNLSNGVSTSREVSPEKVAVVEAQQEVPPLTSEETPVTEDSLRESEETNVEASEPTAKPSDEAEDSTEEDTTTTEVRKIVDHGENMVKKLEETVDSVESKNSESHEEIPDGPQSTLSEKEETVVNDNGNLEED